MPVFYGGLYYPEVYGYPAGNYAQSPGASMDPGYSDSGTPGAYADYLPPIPVPMLEQPDEDGVYPSERPTIYLLAMTDHTILPSTAYWIDGDTLHYISSQGSQNVVSLSLIDLDFSKQLNDSRNVEFSLSPK